MKEIQSYLQAQKKGQSPEILYHLFSSVQSRLHLASLASVPAALQLALHCCALYSSSYLESSLLEVRMDADQHLGPRLGA